MKALKRCFICCALLLSLVLISCGGNETSSDSLDNSDKVEEIGPHTKS